MGLRRRWVYTVAAAIVLMVIGTVMTVWAEGNGRVSDASNDLSPPSSPSSLINALGSSRPALSVRGNRIVNARGQAVQLTGFNNSGAEYACEEGWGIFDTPSTNVTQAMVTAMKTWTGANAVRLPVNEQCWLGLPGIPAAYSGKDYRRAIERYVSMLTSNGFAVILDLAGTAPGTEMSANQEEMPDSHSLTFWQSAATAFRDNSLVLFDLFNEPWPDNDAGSPAAWACWRSGGCIQDSQNGPDRYRAVGMQQLVNVVRGTGARNIIVAEGIQYAETIDQWLEYRPYDPDGNLISSVHVYSFNRCSSPACYYGNMKRVAESVPMLIGEFGPDLTVPFSNALDNSCPAHDVGNTNFDSTLLSWARSNDISWTAWSWNPWGDCWSLIRNFRGEPTDPYGLIVQSALRSQRRSVHI
jgi:endoglucanase